MCEFIVNNRHVEKLLLQHNNLNHLGSIQLTQALSSVKQIKYLDISANNIGSKAFLSIMNMINCDQLRLHTFHCRKNKIIGGQIIGCFKPLAHYGCSLQVLNLKDNFLNSKNSEELRKVCYENLLMEEVNLMGNKDVHAQATDEIESECRKNILILKYILPILPKATSATPKGRNGLFNKYDTRKLVLEDAQFFNMDFVVKFVEMNADSCKTLEFVNVYSQSHYYSLIDYLRNEPAEVRLENLSFSNVKLSPLYMNQIIKACQHITSLKSLSLNNM